MSGENTVSTIAGMLKEVYASEYIDAIPGKSIMQDEIEYVSPEQREGHVYHQPVVLEMENGATYAGGANLGTTYTLNAAVAAQSQDAQIQGSEVVMRAQLAYGVAAKARANDRTAFMNASEYVVRNLLKSHKQRLEIMHRYGGPVSDTNPGQSGLGKILSGTGSSTTRVYTLTLQSWAPGIWFGKKGAALDAYTTAGSHVNTNAQITITAIDLKNRKISVSGNATDLTAVDSAISGGCIFYFFGAYGQEAIGLQNMLSITTSTLFNIDPATYELWKPVPYDAGAVAGSFQAIMQAIDSAVARGLEEEDMLVLVPAVSWTDMMTDYAALRRVDDSYRPEEGENGVGRLVFHSQAGKLTFVPDNLVKYGDMFCIVPSMFKRVGACELTLNHPASDMPMVLEIPDKAGWEIRSFAQQALFCEAPAKQVYIYDVTPTHSA